ncbi:formimidoylglutamase [Acinetobacter dispersus]|uniref:formimidoylglutamase n=1 Tax=Acinetobacter dispersus TaxID=70348 RepID=UPI00132F03A8|nr:formimidoylglutamase [Acinetobacter dispersus]QHH96541.1 formimidoylglutamase [Acinetobacter dispersus]
MNYSFTWQGRKDGEGAEHLRIHQVVNTTPRADYALIGFSSDEGVKRNKGRLGAADAPDSIRAQLANLPVHQPVTIADIGTVVCDGSKLEQAQAELAEQVERSLKQGMKPIVLGGGHEVAFGSFSGLFQYLQNHEPNKKIGIINFDAHFDLREAEQVTSGTPFLNAAKLSEQHQQEFNYLCIGVAKHSNTKVLFETADRLNCTYIYDYELQQQNVETLIEKLTAFTGKVDYLYITVDLDVFSASIAPGVSAPAVKGIDLSVFDPLLEAIKETGKIKVFDVAECNPRFDLDSRTAKLAAYIIFNYIFD